MSPALLQDTVSLGDSRHEEKQQEGFCLTGSHR